MDEAGEVDCSPFRAGGEAAKVLTTIKAAFDLVSDAIGWRIVGMIAVRIRFDGMFSPHPSP